MSPLDFSVKELDQLLDLASDIEKNPEKYAHICDDKRSWDFTFFEHDDYHNSKFEIDNIFHTIKNEIYF